MKMLYQNCLRSLSFLAILSLSLSQANWLNYKNFARYQFERRIQGRQVDAPVNEPPVATPSQLGTGIVNPATTTTSSPASVETKPTTTISANPESTSESTSTPTIATTSTTRARTTPISPTTSTQQTATSVSNPGTITATIETSTTVELITSVVTISGSIITSVTSVTSSTEITELPSQPTDGSSPTNDGINKNSAGITSTTRNTIIGAVVGVSCTALLAVLFLVARKIRKRKKGSEYDPGLADFGSGTPPHEKTSGVGNNRPLNPFQSTLENYHNPARVNASSNF